MTTAVGWAPIVKSEKTADGTLIITGRAASSSVDRDYQIADPDWLDKALGQWYHEPDGGNVREQHDAKRAVGTAIAYDKADHSITAEIVDPVTIAKIEHNVLRGFSWSARNGRVTTDKAAAGGRIIDGQIYEVSVVDRPANPECLFTIAKADGAGDLQVVEAPEFVEVDTTETGGEVDKADDGEPVAVIEKDDAPSVEVTAKGGAKVNPAMFAEILKSLGNPGAPMRGTVTVTARADGSPSVMDTRTPVDAAKADDGADDDKPVGHKPKRYTASDSDTVTCPACQRGNAPDAKHCDQCGHQLKGDPDVKVADSAKADGDGADAVVEKKDMDPNVGGGVDRDKLKASDFVFGDERAFPVVTAGDVPDAVSSWGRYKGKHTFAEFKKNLIALAKRKGFEDKLPSKWTDTKKAVDAAQAATKFLAQRGIDLAKADGDDADAELGDVDNGTAAIAAIARLICSEAEGLAAGRMEEIWDIQLLIQAACALQAFVSNETYQEAALMSETGKADQAATETGTEPADTKTDTAKADGNTAAETDTTNTEGAATGDLTKTELSELLDAAITKAVQPYKDELELVKADMAKVLETPRPDGPARTRTTTHTAVAEKADTLRKEIAYCTAQIDKTGGALQKGYRSRRDKAETELSKLDGAA